MRLPCWQTPWGTRVESNSELTLSTIAKFCQPTFKFLKNKAVETKDEEMGEMVHALEQVVQSLIMGTLELGEKLAEVNLVGEGKNISIRRKGKVDLKTQN